MNAHARHRIERDEALRARAESLGTENAFVVLAEVNALVRRARTSCRSASASPIFRRRQHPECGIEAIKRRQARIHAFRRHRRAARRRGERISARGEARVPARRRGRRRGRKPFIAYTIASVTDSRCRRRVIYPVPDFRSTSRRFSPMAPVPVPIYLREARDFAFDPAELEAKITPQTKLLILNTPHNPTGGMLQPADLDEIAAILVRHPQVWVFADEIYSRLAYAGAFDSLARRPGCSSARSSRDGASKTWAMTGWRIGFVANARSLPYSPLGHQHDSCASQISQWGCVEAITGPQDAAAAMRASFLERRDLIVGLLNKVPGVVCRNPGGAFTHGRTSPRRAASPVARTRRRCASAF
jgi:hypothetical protein